MGSAVRAARTSRMSRLDSVQRMRGIAAVLVVFAHSADLVESRRNQLGPSHIAQIGHVENFGAIGVDLFFIISGFVMALSTEKLTGRRDALDFLALRWIRIAPPYLVVTALLIVLFGVTGHLELDVAGFLNAVIFIPVADLTGYTTPPLGVGWTLSFEFTFYLLMAVLVLVVRRHRALVAIGVLVVASTVGTIAHPRPYILNWATNPILLEFALGIAGYLGWRTGRLGSGVRTRVALGLLGGAVLLTEVIVGFGAVSEVDPVLDGTLSLPRVALWGLPVFAVFLAVLPARTSADRPVARVLRVLGDSSYSIYLVHTIALLVIDVVLRRIPAALPADLVLLIAWIIASAAGIPFHRWVERPVTELLRRRFAARARTRPHLVSDRSLSHDAERASSSE